MKVAEIMTHDPLSVNPNESIGKVEELLADNNIRQLPVLKGNELMGIVTDRDVRAYVVRALLESPAEHEKALNLPVSGLMTSDPVSVAPDDDLREAVELLLEEKFGAVPVVDEAEGLVGIVSYVDVLRCFLDRLDEQ